MKFFGDFLVYSETKEKLKEQILEDFKSRNDQAAVFINGKKTEMTEGRVLVNLILMEPLVENVIPIENDLFTAKDVTQPELEKYFNFLIDRCVPIMDYDEIRKHLGEIICEISDISGELNVAAGHSLSFLDFLKVGKEDPEMFQKMFNPDVKGGQYSDVEGQFKAQGKMLSKYYREHTERELHPYVVSETRNKY